MQVSQALMAVLNVTRFHWKPCKRRDSKSSKVDVHWLDFLGSVALRAPSVQINPYACIVSVCILPVMTQFFGASYEGHPPFQAVEVIGHQLM